MKTATLFLLDTRNGYRDRVKVDLSKDVDLCADPTKGWTQDDVDAHFLDCGFYAFRMGELLYGSLADVYAPWGAEDVDTIKLLTLSVNGVALRVSGNIAYQDEDHFVAVSRAAGLCFELIESSDAAKRRGMSYPFTGLEFELLLDVVTSNLKRVVGAPQSAYAAYRSRSRIELTWLTETGMRFLHVTPTGGVLFETEVPDPDGEGRRRYEAAISYRGGDFR